MRHQPRNPAALPPSPQNPDAAILHELIEAFTALGMYLDVCQYVIQENPQPMPDGLDQIMQKSLSQYERSVTAVRQLQHQLRREDANRPLRQFTSC